MKVNLPWAGLGENSIKSPRSLAAEGQMQLFGRMPSNRAPKEDVEGEPSPNDATASPELALCRGVGDLVCRKPRG